MHRVQQHSLRYETIYGGATRGARMAFCVYRTQLRNGGTGSGATSGRTLSSFRTKRILNSFARACTQNVSYSVSRSYARRCWIASCFLVRMEIELFSPDLFPISVIHYPLKNRQALTAAGDQVPDPFPSYWAILRDRLALEALLFRTVGNCGLTLQVSQIAVWLYRQSINSHADVFCASPCANYVRGMLIFSPIAT